METVYLCPKCGRVIGAEDGERYDYACPKCGYDYWLKGLKKEIKK